MKLLLVFAFSVLTLTSSSQVQFEYRAYNLPGSAPSAGADQLKLFLTTRPASDNDSLIAAMKNYIETRQLKSGVVNLSQDNMPCVIPNTKLMTPMPNAWKKDSSRIESPGSIPNPARPKRLKPLVIPINQKLPCK